MDNYFAKRKFKIEYKRPGEGILPGAEFHFRSELESTHPDWKTLLVLVLDEGQNSESESVKYKWRISSRPIETWAEAGFLQDTLGGLGHRIVAWVWPDG
jgi:hypothetical protein